VRGESEASDGRRPTASVRESGTQLERLANRIAGGSRCLADPIAAMLKRTMGRVLARGVEG